MNMSIISYETQKWVLQKIMVKDMYSFTLLVCHLLHNPLRRTHMSYYNKQSFYKATYHILLSSMKTLQSSISIFQLGIGVIAWLKFLYGHISISGVFSLFIVPSPFFVHCPY